jgi:hypothetical protein
MGIHMGLADMERTVARVYEQPVFFYKLIVTMRQEMYLLSAVCEFGAVIATDGTYAYYSVSHVLFV